MSGPVFVTGAGFGVDAGELVGGRESARYPLVGEVIETCFGLSSLPENKSVEDLFQQSLDQKEAEPFERLSDMIMAADHYITPYLSVGGEYEENPYRQFLAAHPAAPILTFNYDSLPEILLLSEGVWRPEDGFGLPVAAELAPNLVRPPELPDVSTRQVLHLHGTFMVYPSTFFVEHRPGREIDLIRQRDEPTFLFDPDVLSGGFFPFERIPPGPSYQGTAERVIAPVPNKAEGLKGEFIVRVHNRALAVLGSADVVAWIGFSFNEHDARSFDHLLRAAEHVPQLIVDPDAEEIVSRLQGTYSTLTLRPVEMGFHAWVNGGYPGL